MVVQICSIGLQAVAVSLSWHKTDCRLTFLSKSIWNSGHNCSVQHFPLCEAVSQVEHDCLRCCSHLARRSGDLPLDDFTVCFISSFAWNSFEEQKLLSKVLFHFQLSFSFILFQLPFPALHTTVAKETLLEISCNPYELKCEHLATGGHGAAKWIDKASRAELYGYRSYH